MEDSKKRIRQMVGIVVAIVVYYLVHEGAHWLYALCIGAFREIRFLGLGIQVDIFREQMTDTQLGWFCLAGPLATLVAAWVMVLSYKRICACKNNLLKAIAWYVTIVLLMLDPLYLSLFYHFVGGGDMNGIRLLLPEFVFALLFGLLAVGHLLLIWKLLLPAYKRAFSH